MSNDNIVQLSPDKIKFSSIDEALTAIAAGRAVIVIDDEDRENEGDLVCAASTISPQMVNFMARECRGLICVTLPSARAAQLSLHAMVADNTDPNQTAFTVSVDASPRFGVGTGVSAADRAITIQRLADPSAKPDDFRRPGHIFPLQAQEGGVLKRVGHTEAATDLARLAGVAPVGVICEIMNDDGTMARRDDLFAFAKKHGVPFITIAQLIAYRLQKERFVQRVAVNKVDTRYGAFTAVVYRNELNGVEHFALVKGEVDTLREAMPLIRIHNEAPMNDLFGGNLDGGELNLALRQLQEQESAVLVYLRQTPFGSVTLAQQVTGTEKSDDDYTASAMQTKRDYGIGAQILYDLGIKQFRLMTDSKGKIVALKGYGLEVVDTQSLTPAPKWQPKQAPQHVEDHAPAMQPDLMPLAKAPEKQVETIKEPKVMTMKMGQQIVFEG